jgi:hypothetical protein
MAHWPDDWLELAPVRGEAPRRDKTGLRKRLSMIRKYGVCKEGWTGRVLLRGARREKRRGTADD